MRLIEVARRVLAEEPRASMASIAAAAGFGRNTIHRHFPTRQYLLDAVGKLIAEEAAVNDEDVLRPAGELGSPGPSPLLVSEVLNKVPPFRIGDQVVAEIQRLAGVVAAAIYLVDLDGKQLCRLAGPETFPEVLEVDAGVGPEITREALPALRAALRSLLPSVVATPLLLRGRATGVILTLGTQTEEELRQLASVAAVTLELSNRYTDEGHRVQRAKPTTPAAEIQQNMLPPRIVRVTGAGLAGNVTPGYDIGGDWFDYADNPEGTWLGIADTEGVGPRTAAVASVVLGAFRSARHLEGATPASVVRAMHDTVLELGVFAVPVSVTVAVWFGATSTVQWTTCGTVRPILLEADGDGTARMIGENHGPLGSDDLPRPLRIQSQRLRAGDRMIFTSDGLLEHVRPGRSAFGLAGITEAAADHRTASAGSLVHAIERAAVDGDGPGFQDDATLMVLAPNAATPVG